MFGTLIGKECKQVLRSLVFYIYLLIFILFLTSQLGRVNVVSEPQKGQEDYGITRSTKPEDIMSVTLEILSIESENNSYATYPVGFYKGVILSDEENNQVKKIVAYCNSNEISYAQFETKMKEVSDIIGKGSYYETDNYRAGVDVPMTYEEAYQSYETICEKDGITDAYMRLFCDYAGIILGLLPIFVGVTRCVRDKRTKVEGVIFSKSAGSLKIVLSRYIANLIMIFLPVLILSFALQTPYMYQAFTLGVHSHPLAFLFYSVVWILPEVAFVLALSFLLTELLNGIIAIIVQVFIAVGALFTGSSSGLTGNFGLNLMPRWNTFGDTMNFINVQADLYRNRLIFAVLAVVILLLATFVYHWKRRGGVMFYAKKR